MEKKFSVEGSADAVREKTASPSGEDRRQRESILSISMSRQLAHGQAVSSLAYEVAKEMELPKQICRDIAVAGFFHDIGKTELELPEGFGDDAMVVEEMNYVLTHPVKGAEILRRHGYSEEICSYVLHHHENCDGSGYPDHLEGWNIPLGAAVLRVCDIFCALVEDREYRGSFSPEDAFEVLRDEVKDYDLQAFLALQRVIHDSEGNIRIPEISEEVKGVWKESCH